MQFLPETTQTAYSTLLQKVQSSRYAKLNQVGFTTKRPKDQTYWYCQYTDISGARRQRYMGIDSEELRTSIEDAKQSQLASGTILADRKRLVAMITAGGGTPEKGRPAKIIEKLSDAGVFDAGGLLIGSYAFSCYGNLLGVTFDDAMRRTEDMDIACDQSIEIGFMCDVKADVAAVAPEMAQPKQINPWVPPYDMVASDGFKLEFLTSRPDPSHKEPIKIERFGINALPLDFLEFIIQNAVQAVVLYGSGILVNIPDPARFAIHKLAVSQLRPSSTPEKKRKDLAQASAVIEYLLEENPGSLLLATDAAKQLGNTFSTLVEVAMANMPNKLLAAKLITECWAPSQQY